MAKKDNSKKANVNSINTVSSTIESNCMPENQKPANITRMNPFDAMLHNLNIDIARHETGIYTHRMQMNSHETALLHAINAHADMIIDRQIENQETMIRNEMIIIRNGLTAMGLSFDETVIRQKAIEKLNLPIVRTVTKTAQQKAGIRIRSNADNAGNTDNDLIKRVLIAHNGVTFKDLPANVQNEFNSTTRAKYPSVCGYYRQLVNGNGQGVIADLLATKTAASITAEDIKSLNLDPSTKGRFRQALEIYLNK